MATESAAVFLSIVETPGAKVGLWATLFARDRFYNEVLTSPSGEVFSRATIIESHYPRDLLRQFDSTASALDFLAGKWLITRTRLSAPFSVQTFEFEIAPIPINAINQVAPTLLSPLPGPKVKNGTTFEFDWDYMPDGSALSQSVYTIVPQFDPPSSFTRPIVPTLTPSTDWHNTGSTGTGGRLFKHTETIVPDTDKNRFLISFEATPTALPLDVEITFGSYSPLGNYVTPRSDLPVPWNSVDLDYSFGIDPFFVTLTVPEPNSLGLACAVVYCGCSIRRRSRA